MAADEEKPQEENQEEAHEVTVEQTSNKSKKTLFIIVGIVIFLILAAAGFFFSPIGKKMMGKNHAEAPVVEKVGLEKIPKTIYYEIPELFVNLNTPGRKANFLKIAISLELSDEKHVKHIDQVKPRIIDHTQVYLRQLKLDDFKGSSGLQKLREELLTRINAAASPVKVKDVLFKEMLVQ